MLPYYAMLWYFAFAVHFAAYSRSIIKTFYAALTNLSMKYLMMCKVYTDVGGIK